MISLLEATRSAAPTFVDAVLRQAAGRTGATAISLPAQALFEPPSERELDVLRLIADGCSNAEIAERLVIAPGTVKRHINNLYSKLDVISRTQALARARTLGLLE